MRRQTQHLIVAMLLCAGSITFAQSKPADPNSGPAPLPTMAELQEMYESGAYRTAVQQIARVLRLRGAAAQPYDRDALQLLRGQTMLAMDDPRAAKRAFELAEKSAQTDIAMKAHGYIALISRSDLTMYTRRTGDKAEINIADAKAQPAALNAVLDDELPAFQNDAVAATKADNLAPSIALIPRMLDLAAMEFLATGKYERIQPIIKPIGEHARELTGRELTRQDQNISAIEIVANQLIDTGGFIGHRGLVSDERESLYQLIGYLDKIEDAMKRGQSIARAVDGNADTWDPLIEQAVQLKTRAQSVLDAEGIRTANDTFERSR